MTDFEEEVNRLLAVNPTLAVIRVTEELESERTRRKRVTAILLRVLSKMSRNGEFPMFSDLFELCDICAEDKYG